jgi:YVTN family beta-propeller protein
MKRWLSWGLGIIGSVGAATTAHAGASLMVTGPRDETLALIDTERDELAAALAGDGLRAPSGAAALRPDGRVIYTVDEVGEAIAVLDAETGARLARIRVGGRPTSVVFAPDGKRAYVTTTPGAVEVLDAELHRAVSRIALGGGSAEALGAAIAPDGAWLFVSNGRAGTVSIVDLPEAREVDTVDDVGGRPSGIALSSDGEKLYTANGPSGEVAVIDVRGRCVTKRIRVGAPPTGLTVIGEDRATHSLPQLQRRPHVLPTSLHSRSPLR